MPDTGRREQRNHSLDYFKHLTTLATGSTLLLATFAEKLTGTSWRPLVRVSLVGFLLTILGTVVAHTVALFDVSEKEATPEWLAALGMRALFVAWVGFLTGIVAIGVFGIRNIH
jgi:hypothetical protein